MHAVYLLVCLYACLLACLYPSDFARELEVKCSLGHVRITADSKSGSILGNDMLFFQDLLSVIVILQCTCMRISLVPMHLMYVGQG